MRADTPNCATGFPSTSVLSCSHFTHETTQQEVGSPFPGSRGSWKPPVCSTNQHLHLPRGFLPLSLGPWGALALRAHYKLPPLFTDEETEARHSKSVTQQGLEPSLEGSLGGGLSGTFPKGLLGVLKTRALVRDVNLLASSVGSSCQLLAESSSPSWVGL